jgi:hypothetical protein
MAAQLLIRRLNQAEEQRAIDDQPVTIGSDAACHIVLTDEGVLAHHAVVQMHENKRYAIAYDESGPLRTEKGPTTQLRLEDGSRFNVGTTQFELRNGAAAAKSLLDNPEQAAQDLMETITRIKAEMGRIVIGQTDVVNQVLTALFAHARPGQDAHGQHARSRARSPGQARPVHARLDARRHHRHPGARAGSQQHQPRLQVQARPDLHQPAAGG